MSEAETERNNAVVAYVRAHPEASMRDIGEQFNLSRARIQAICRAANLFRHGPFYYCQRCRKKVALDMDRIRNRDKSVFLPFKAKCCPGCYTEAK